MLFFFFSIVTFKLHLYLSDARISSNRPLPLDSKVIKLLKDKDDVNVVEKVHVSQKYSPILRSEHGEPRPADNIPRLEPDLSDEFAAHLRITRQPPPVGSIFPRPSLKRETFDEASNGAFHAIFGFSLAHILFSVES
jgi:hypothetical protein